MLTCQLVNSEQVLTCETQQRAQGKFVFFMNMTLQYYNQPHITVEEQIQLLKWGQIGQNNKQGCHAKTSVGDTFFYIARQQN